MHIHEKNSALTRSNGEEEFFLVALTHHWSCWHLLLHFLLYFSPNKSAFAIFPSLVGKPMKFAERSKRTFNPACIRFVSSFYCALPCGIKHAIILSSIDCIRWELFNIFFTTDNVLIIKLVKIVKVWSKPEVDFFNCYIHKFQAN